MIPPFVQTIKTGIQRSIARWRAFFELKTVARPTGDRGRSNIVAFAVLRNEMLRLPAFFQHYKNLGVHKYIIVDNNSTDDTAAYLASRDDVLLLSTTANFVGKERWINYLLHKYGQGKWCLVVDADELLDYPYSKYVSLPDLCLYLEQVGANALHAILLDLYPNEPLVNLDYRQSENYFTREWYFDPYDSLEKAPRVFYRGSGLNFRFMGGMRKRIFGVSPCCSKFPLFRFNRSMFLTDGQHYLESAHFSTLRAVLYHFKYLQDFAEHVHEEIQRGQYLWAAGEYQAYAKGLTQAPEDFVFKNESSIKLRDTQQLIECGFMTHSEDYKDFIRTLGSAATS